MKLIRAMLLILSVVLPTSWTIAHAADGMNDGSGSGDMKKGKTKKSKKKSGDMGDKGDKGDMGDAKKGDMAK